MSFKAIPPLDGLRGISILFVLLCHCNIAGGFFSGGFIGVDIFFVTSGFLITSILLEEWHEHQRIDLGTFYLRRACRLLPALFVMVAVYVLVGVIFTSNGFGFVKDALWAVSYIANWSHIYNHEHDFLEHSWSLSIEEQFYLLWPLCLILLIRRVRSQQGIFWVILTAAVLSTGLRLALQRSGSEITRLYMGLDTRADAILFGCATAFLARMARPQMNSWRLAVMQHASLAAAGGLVIIALSARYDGWNMVRYGYFAAALLTAVIIFYLPMHKGGALVAILNNGGLIQTGKISYGIYLWHYPILRMLQAHFGYDWLWTMLYGVPLSYLAALASCRLVEKPFLSLGKRKIAAAVLPAEVNTNL